MSFDLAAFKTKFAAAEDIPALLASDFYETAMAKPEDPEWTLWRCTYDYADDTENVQAAKDVATSFLKNTANCRSEVFGVMVVLEPGFAVEGLWLVKGEDPEATLFAKCEDTSWFSWSQLGPAMLDPVKKEVEALWAAKDTYNGKSVSDKQVLTE